MKKIDILISCTLAVLSLFLLKDLYKPGFYTSHDGPNQMVRLYHFNQALQDGQFPPRWGGNLLHGYGYPLLIFSYHLPWWIAQIPFLMGADIFTSIKFVFIITYVFSAITMYFYLKTLWGRSAAFIASGIYIVTPFRFVDIFVRAALGESVSFAFIPLVFWSIHLLRFRYRFSSLFVGIVGVAGLLLSHVMIFSLLFMPLVLLFTLNALLTKNRLKYVLRIFALFAGGLGISAYYVLPAVYYRPMTIFTDKFSGAYAYNFTSLSKLLYSPWGYNGIDLPDEMSRQVGLTLWLVFLLSVFVTVWLIYKEIRKKSVQRQHLSIGIVCIFSFFFAVFMMIKESHFLWKYIRSFALVEFPWRHLAVTTFLGSCLSGYVISAFKQRYLKAGIILFLIFVTAYTNRNYLRINKVDDTPVRTWVDSESTTSLLNEYLPKWVDPTNIKKRKFYIESDIPVRQIIQTSNTVTFEYSSPKVTRIIIHHMYFPGWKAYINENEIGIKKTASGSMQLYVPKGVQKVNLYYKETIPMKLGNFISLSTFILLPILWILQKDRIKGSKK